MVGGTGLYLRAALAELELRPPVPAEVRAEVERELAERGAEALHAELPSELASGVHPNDRKRIARLTELTRLGIAPHASSEGLWTEQPPPTRPCSSGSRSIATSSSAGSTRGSTRWSRRAPPSEVEPRGALGRLAHRARGDRVRGAARGRRGGDEARPSGRTRGAS